MKDVIHLLPESLANQIAAGEVVQRPASVVKELLENAVDAGGSNISLIVKEAGKALVQVVDDGIGMSENDARMSFERHATSKITKTEDLFAIRTFGFRGEALASIAAVAQVEMRTRREADETGILLRIEGSEVTHLEPEACSKGTSISVKNLFFNVPARRKFLKSPQVEMRHILDEFQRVALANPQLAMAFYQNDMEQYKLKAGKLAKRIVGLFGKNYQEQLIPCAEEVEYVQVQGYIGRPEIAKKTRGEQFFFVNNRFIKHHALNHAVSTAFGNLLPDDSFPFYVLFLQIDPKHVDVNVHPTKTEVKFDDERTLYAVIHAAVRQALAGFGVAPLLDFDTDVNFGTEGKPLTSNPRTVSVMSGSWPAAHKPSAKHWEQLYTPASQDKPANWELPTQLDNSPAAPDKEILSSSANSLESEKMQKDSLLTAERKITLQLRNRYLLSPVKSGIMLIDQQAAYERILFDRFLKHIQLQSGASQKLIFPEKFPMQPADLAIMAEMENTLMALGFLLQIESGKVLAIQGIPPEIQGMDVLEILEALLEQWKNEKQNLTIGEAEKTAQLLSKRAAAKNVRPLEEQEMKLLIEQLFACSNPNYTPDGQKIIAMLNMEKIEMLFK